MAKMPQLRVVIQSLADAKAGKAITPGVTVDDLKSGKMKPADDFTVGILEGGTVGGQTSLMFIAKDGDKHIYFEMTKNIFEGLAGAFRGADERFRSQKNS